MYRITQGATGADVYFIEGLNGVFVVSDFKEFSTYYSGND